jgi:putative photosynthetic complex assembly protein 2
MADQAPWTVVYLWPSLYAIGVWWLSTGVLMWLAHRSLPVARRVVVALTPLLAVALWQLAVASSDMSIAGAYRAFTWATIAWGWLVLSYYSDVITGPAPVRPIPPPGLRRFWVAARANMHHDALGVVLLLTGAALHYGAANMLGLWTLVALWAMHTSARLLVFCGVPTFSEALLPRRFVKRMGGLWEKRAANPLFPVAITITTLFDVAIARQAAAAPTVAAAVALAMLVCMVTLGIIELWLLMLPWELPLWNWAVTVPEPAPRPADPLPAPETAPVPPRSGHLNLG